MSPDPAANRRFIACSGEVWRYKVSCLGPANWVSRLSSPSSGVPATDSTGVSTSSTERSEKKERMSDRTAARSLSVFLVAVGCQDLEFIWSGMNYVSERVTHADINVSFKFFVPKKVIRWTNNHHSGTKVKLAYFIASLIRMFAQIGVLPQKWLTTLDFS